MRKEREKRVNSVDGRIWDEGHIIKLERRRGDARAHLDTNSHFLSPVPGNSVPELQKTLRKGYSA